MMFKTSMKQEASDSNMPQIYIQEEIKITSLKRKVTRPCKNENQ